MADDDSVTQWINAVRDGDELAAKELWNRYHSGLMRMARSRMNSLPRAVYDEEDAALSTFNLVFSKLKEGGYDQLDDRHELWNLMITVLMRKISHRAEYEFAQKRTAPPVTIPKSVDVEEAQGTDIDPVEQEGVHLLELLKDPNLEKVAIWKLEGYTDGDIAQMLGRTRRTVQRMLKLIRDTWRMELESLSK